MKTPLHFEGLEKAKLPARPAHLAIGMFDGVHLGHQSVIASAAHSAQRSDGLAGVLTFQPHPSRVLRPENPTLMLMSRDTKRRVLSRLELDFIVEQEFTREYARTPAKEFVPFLRRCLPNLAALYVGENWRFGKDREGDVAMLVEEGGRAGIGVFSAQRLNHNGAPISSSRIRELVAAGKIADANELLGYSYFAEGCVQEGRRLGREIGFPTLNIPWRPELRPKLGVYAVSIVDKTGRTSLGVANYGLRPTIGDVSEPLLEVHVLGESDAGPGDSVTVHWLEFLRAEQRFASVEELRSQIAEDRKNALGFFARFASA